MSDTDIVVRLRTDSLAAADEIVRLRQQMILLRAERDEARREVMLWISERSSTSEMTAEYKKRGWEYLKENTHD